MSRHERDPLAELASAFLTGQGPSSMEEAASVLKLLAAAGMDALPGRPEAAAPAPAGDPDQSRLLLMEARYRALVEQIPAVVFLASLEGGLSDIYVSPQIEALLGFTQKEWTSNPVLWFRQLHPDERVELSREFARACVTGRPWRGILRVFSRDGALKWVHAEAQLVRDDAGRPLFLQGVAFDITQQQEAQKTHEQLLLEQGAREAAEASAHRASFLSEVSKALAASFDYEATLNQVARLFVPEIADWSAIDLVQADGSLAPVALVHADAAKLAKILRLRQRYPTRRDGSRGIGRVVRTGKPELVPEVDDAVLSALAEDDAHLEALRELGPRSYLIVPMRARDTVLGALTLVTAESGRRYGPGDLAVAEDIAQRASLAIDNARLYREAHEASRSKDEFLATLSHELRTPLNAIVGWAHILRDTPGAVSDDMRKAVETIMRNAQIQSQLISDILDVSRIIAGKLVLNLRAVDLSAVIQAALDTVMPAAHGKQVRIAPIIDVAAGPISGDPDRLQQVVWNLLSNAIKFTPKGGRVEIRLEAVSSHVALTVEDDGPGIDPEFLPYVFERFRQADSSSSRRHGGLGLGLAIVRHLVELHGGTAEAGNREGRSGAIFKIKLPRRSVAAERLTAERHPAAEAEAAVSLANAPDLKGVRVLVVDDQADAREVVKAILEMCDAETVTAATAEEAFDKLGEEHFDVLLADIEMPGEDGYTLIRRIRGLPVERGGAIPAAALTAYASTQDRVRALDAGFQMHVPKPVQPLELVAVVASLARSAPGRRR
jgi:PAS domain S-box-containing protein